MLRHLTTILALLLFAACLPAQAQELGKFIADLDKALQLKDDHMVDLAVKSRPLQCVQYFQELQLLIADHRGLDSQPKVDAMKASWKRSFDNSATLDKVEQWTSAQDPKSYTSFTKYRNNIIRAWDFYNEAKQLGKRDGFEKARDTLMETARQMESTGHKIEAAETWGLVAVCLSTMPEKTLQDRRDQVFALEQYVAFRKEWEFTRDPIYNKNAEFLKAEKASIERDEKVADKKKTEGYAEGARGVEGLVMPNSTEALSELQFEPLASWEELDYCQKGGPVPAYWWLNPFGKETKSAKLNWFRRLDLHLVRVATTKFGVSLNPDDSKLNQDIELSNKGKPSSFFLDPEKKVPYAMFFWTGSDKEHVGEAEVNMAPSDTNTPVYYRSAASWKTTIGGEQVVFYDDNTNGKPMDGDPMEGKFPMVTLGAPSTETPLLDSMRIGKGPRVPFSEFAYVGGAWRWIHRVENQSGTEIKVGTKPLNPEYCKTAKVKLAWAGGKTSAPAQLVIRGTGDFANACFDVASGKEIEVPAATYQVLWGRIVQAKGNRVQMMATIYTGDCKAFTVEAGKTFDLKMGAPFSLAFTRGGGESDPDVRIDGARVVVHESSGALITELQGTGMTVVPEVVAAKDKDGKGASVIGKFKKLTDPELLNVIARNKTYDAIGLQLACFPVPDGAKDTMELKAKLPAPGYKVGLVAHKHPLFGELKSAFQ